MNGGNQVTAGTTVKSRLLRLIKPRLSIRVFLYFMLIALVPVIVVSTWLVSAAREQLLADTGRRQEIIAKDYANLIDNFAVSNLEQLSIFARLYSQGTLSFSASEKQLSQLLYQNKSLEKIRLILADGREQSLSVKDGRVVPGLTAQPAVNTNAVNIFNNSPKKPSYILTVGRDSGSNKPQISMGVPILEKYLSPEINVVSTFQNTTSSNAIGVIQASFDISSLWDNFISDNLGNQTNRVAAYVVDEAGNLASHSDRLILDITKTFKSVDVVKEIIQSNKNTATNKIATSETTDFNGNRVLSSPVKLTMSSGWAVVVEEPIESIYSGVRGYITSAIIVSLSTIILAVIISLYFSRQITRPLQTLSQGARRMEAGDFNTQIRLNTRDEFEELAQSFNNMGRGIATLVRDLQSNNIRLVIEKAKLNNIIGSVSDGIIAIGRNDVIISANPQASYLIKMLPSDVKGKKIADLFKWERDGGVCIPNFSKPGIYKYDDLILRNKDSVFYLDLTVAVLEKNIASSDEDVVAIITIRDQTATRELSFMKLDFVAIAAHELRTPLTVVRGYLDMLNSSAAKQMSVYNLENLQKAIVGANQLRDLINKLLNIARIERGDMEIFIEKLDLLELVSENVDQHISVANQKQQTINFKSDSENPVYVPADPASIVEVMNNLLGNALKYTNKGGEVSVELRVDADNVVVRISDNGPGIPTELRSKLFTKFYRAERSMIAGSRGTGLGLFISKTIIDLQNGSIGIEPDNGKGSTFYFSLPLYNAMRDDELITKKTSGGIRGWFKKHTNH